MAARPLTLKQELWVEAFLGPAAGNATEACRRAGYRGNDNTLATMGAKLVRHGAVVALVKARVREIAGDTDVILAETWKVASAPISACMVVTKPATYLDNGEKLDDMHVRLDYAAKVRALELLMRYNRMLEEKAPVEATVKALIGIDVSRI